MFDMVLKHLNDLNIMIAKLCLLPQWVRSSAPNTPLSFPALGHLAKNNTDIQKRTSEFLKAIGKDQELHMKFASFVDKWVKMCKNKISGNYFLPSAA